MKVKGLPTGREANFVAVVDGTTSYVSSDALTSIPEGKKWMKIDYSAAGAGAASASPASAGPKEGLKVLEHVQNVEKVGEEDIEGAPTTHYSGTLPTSSKVFGVELHESTSAIDVWIDGQGRVRREHLVLSGSVGESSVSSTTDVSINFVGLLMKSGAR